MDSQPSRVNENVSEPHAPSADVRFRKASISNLDEPYRDAVATAISRVLSTEIAETTYAQIVDGLPLPEVLQDVYGDLICPDHPIHQHTQLKDGTPDTISRFRDDFGSKCPPIRRSGSALQVVHTWTPAQDDYHGSLWWRFNRDGPPATLFLHTWYRDHAQYPHGAADVAGYWAENRVLGGVVLFDREEASKVGAGPDAVYLHPDRAEVTYRICLLTDAQKKALLDFLLDPPGTGSSSTRSSGVSKQTQTCPLPIIPDETNTQRVDPEEPIRCTGVYRDQWERAMPPPLWMGDGRGSCVYNPLDFVTKSDQDDARSRFRSRGDRRDD
ncbi:hypothetical protein Daus18300_006023 [Diaporthe australafricana]|uniref:Uncharacterized protein n=1 Tax=Diaporthe australafricana TaxID=127596 RepID=A0ABR3WX89_9PEZI